MSNFCYVESCFNGLCYVGYSNDFLMVYNVRSTSRLSAWSQDHFVVYVAKPFYKLHKKMQMAVALWMLFRCFDKTFQKIVTGRNKNSRIYNQTEFRTKKPVFHSVPKL